MTGTYFNDGRPQYQSTPEPKRGRKGLLTTERTNNGTVDV